MKATAPGDVRAVTCVTRMKRGSPAVIGSVVVHEPLE